MRNKANPITGLILFFRGAQTTLRFLSEPISDILVDISGDKVQAPNRELYR